jgi:hypothetical protein
MRKSLERISFDSRESLKQPTPTHRPHFQFPAYFKNFKHIMKTSTMEMAKRSLKIKFRNHPLAISIQDNDGEWEEKGN